MKVLVTGGTGMLGSAFKRAKTSHQIISVGSKDYDLRDQRAASYMISDHTPDAIIHLAARVGGVKGNTDYVANFYHDNILINTNVLDAAQSFGVPKVLSLLSTCIYPDQCTYPLTENQIHSGAPHVSNFGYAYAKRMLDVHSKAIRQQYGLKYITAVPNNLYGPNDNFDLDNGHVIPAIIRKSNEAKQLGKEMVLWGSGRPLREFTYSLDIAEILLFLIENYDDPEPINIGNTSEVSIHDVANMICQEIGYGDDILWDFSKPEGQHRKPSDNSKLLQLGWKKENYTPLYRGIKMTCRWFLKNYPNVRGV